MHKLVSVGSTTLLMLSTLACLILAASAEGIGPP